MKAFTIDAEILAGSKIWPAPTSPGVTPIYESPNQSVLPTPVSETSTGLANAGAPSSGRLTSPSPLSGGNGWL